MFRTAAAAAALGLTAGLYLSTGTAMAEPEDSLITTERPAVEGKTDAGVRITDAKPDDNSLVLETHKGNIDVEAPAGKVTIQSHKGTGTIFGVRSDFDMQTHKGQFKVEILELHDLQVQTHKGDVALSVHAASNFTIHGDSHKGDIDVTGFAVEKKQEKRSTYIFHKQGSGANRIDLQTHKGNITLDFVK